MNMKDIMEESKKKALPDQEAIRANVLSGKGGLARRRIYKRWISIAVVVCFAFVAMFAGNLLFGIKTEAEDFRDGFSLKAVSMDKYGVLPTSGFTLKSRNPATLEEVQTWLTLTDGTKLEIKEAALAGEVGVAAFDVKPLGNLASDKIYKFVLKREGKEDVTWGFQTTTKMQVVGSLPAPDATKVGILSGIEIYFSRVGNYLDPEKFFSISPNVEGSLKTEQGRIVFVPKYPLAEETVYKVKVLKGFGIANSQNVLDKDFEFSFETASKAEGTTSELNFSRNSFYFYPGITQKVGLNFWTDGYEGKDSITFSVYKYDGFESFNTDFLALQALPSWAVSSKKAFDAISETDKIKTMTFSSKIKDNDEYKLPTALAQGYYMIRATIGNLVATALMQVNPLALQIAKVGKQNLLWVMNGVTSEPVANAKINQYQLNESKKWDEIGTAKTTGADGVAKADALDSAIYKVTDSNETPLLYLENYATPYIMSNYASKGFMPTINSAGNWWNYLAFDKPLYLVTDQLQFWGFAQERQTYRTPKSFDVEVRQSWGAYYFEGYGYALENVYWYNDNAASPALLTTRVDAEKGVFSGELTLSTLAEGTYSLAIKSEGNLVAMKDFEIKKYEKPEFQFNVTSDKTAMFWNQAAKIQLEAKFFDGTGVPNTKVSYVANGGSNGGALQSGTVKLDDQGMFSYLYNPKVLDYPIDEWSLSSYDTISFSSKFPLVGDVNKDQQIEVFHHNRTLDFKANEVGKNIVLTGTTKNVDPNAAYENYKIAPNTRVTGRFTYNWTTERLTGYKYDPINKVNEPQYYSDWHVKDVKTFSLMSNDKGKINLKFATPKKPNKGTDITLEISTFDTWGEKYSQNSDVYKLEQSYSTDTNDYNNAEAGIFPSKDTASIGDTVKFRLLKNEKMLASKYSMFLVMNNGLLDYKVAKTSEFTLTFGEQHSPGVEVEMIRFRNTGCETYSATVIEKYKEKGLKITLTPNKTKFIPGEDATYKIQVTDKNGNPVACVVNLSLVDNALLALRSQDINVIEELYAFPGSGYDGFESSHDSNYGYGDYYFREFYYGGMALGPPPTSSNTAGKNDTKTWAAPAERQVAKAVRVRQKFLDVAAFKLIKTDANGAGEVTIPMPDNITSWRAIASGISDKRLAGQATVEVVTSLDMFIQQTVCGEYLVGDSPKFAAAAFGVKLNRDDVISYTSELTLPSGKVQTFSGTAKAFKQIQIPAGKLTEGGYELKITAQSGIYADALLKKFRVIKTFQKHLNTYNVDAVPGAQFKTAQGLVDVMFSDKGLAEVYGGFAQIAYYYDSRLDGAIASLQSQAFIDSNFYKISPDANDTPDLSRFQSTTGGLALLEKGQDDVFVSALAASYVAQHPELGIDKSNLIKFLSSKAQNGLTGEKGAAIYGLITLGEPKIDVLAELAAVQNLGVTDALYVALAYEWIGETPKASTIFSQVIAPRIVAEGGTYAISGLTGDERVVVTSLAAELASQLRKEQADGLYKFVIANPATGTLTSLQEYAYMTSKFERVGRTETKVVYELNGKRKTISLNGTTSEYLTITGEQLKSLKIIEGAATASVSITQWESGVPEDAVKDGIGMTTKFYPLNSSKASTHFKAGDVVRVEMYINLTSYARASFDVVSSLPAGMRAIENINAVDDYSRDDAYWSEVQGQVISFGAYKGEWSTVDHGVLYARVVAEGTYNVQPMYAKDYENDKTYVNSAGTSVTVGK
ncbi:MAG: Ig-like domain-containing protein [Clostridia bacterium]